ncbi:MAG TPA: flagellar basal body rod protein FlgB [Gammaproteobacteria bacterium]|nr:flagellar basal body rod protein FlgB [Gammaproteobacteria bacterium]
MSNLDKLFGIHPQALVLRSQRTSLLAANIANADTPNFKARDIDFKEAMANQIQPPKFQVMRSNANHLAMPSNITTTAALKYRNPQQASLDGNTVESQVEQSQFANNAIRYQASLTFLNGKTNGMLKALRGE